MGTDRPASEFPAKSAGNSCQACQSFRSSVPPGYRMMGEVARQQLFLIDTFGFIFRAYHARARSGAPPMRTSTGFSTEAVYIFNNMLRKLSKQYGPAYVAAV